MLFFVSKKNYKEKSITNKQKINILNTSYLPIQKEEKISPNKSSDE